MSREATTAKKERPRAATTSYTVRFRKRQRRRTRPHQEATTGRIPRVTRLLALAHKIDGMIRAGEIKNWAEAARLLGVTRARMTQIANLALLAPIIQEMILNLSPHEEGRHRVSEHDIRPLVRFVEWTMQHRAWPQLTRHNTSSS